MGMEDELETYKVEEASQRLKKMVSPFILRRLKGGCFIGFT